MRTTYFLFILMLSALPSFSQEWESVTPPPDFYTDHTYGFSIDGMGYLVAGTTEFNGPTKAFFQFDPVEDTWTTLEEFPGADRLQTRSKHRISLATHRQSFQPERRAQLRGGECAPYRPEGANQY